MSKRTGTELFSRVAFPFSVRIYTFPLKITGSDDVSNYFEVLDSKGPFMLRALHARAVAFSSFPDLVKGVERTGQVNAERKLKNCPPEKVVAMTKEPGMN